MRARLQFSGSRRLAATAAAISAVVAGVGLAGAPAAQSAPDAQCPSAFPTADLTAGDAVNGLTVTSGTDPDSFDGTVLGVLEDGIAPGVDMILVNLDSPTINRVGVWSGMSGSPVYTNDHRLIGAVSYSLGTGPSSVAGVTPAADMYKLVQSAPVTRTAPRAKVALTKGLVRRVAKAGAAADGTTMRRLRVPVGMSGLGTERLKSLAPALNGRGVHLADAPAGPTSSEDIPIDAGGNLAASMSYGTITTAGIGTATAVCGNQVVGFGHPMNYTGPATMSLHGARATHIQDDPTLSGFKVANLGAPIGTIDQDRLAGISGSTSALPTSYDITSDATDGDATKTADTHVTMQQLMPEIGFSNIIAAQDQALDRVGKGTVSADWTIRGLRKDGSPFSFTRSNLYADPDDVSVASAYALSDDLYEIQENPGEVVKITSVTSSSHLEDVYESYVIAKVQAYRGGHWVTLQQRQPGWLRAGRTTPLRVFVTSREGEPRTLNLNVTVPKRAAGRIGSLTLTGGNEGDFFSDDFFDLEDEGFFFEDEVPAPSSSTFPQVLKALGSGPKNNEVQATLRFRSAPGAARKAKKTSVSMDRVVSGFKHYRVIARR